MRKNNLSEYTQSYKAQAVVDAEGSQLVVGARVTNTGVDRQELASHVDSLPAEIGTPDEILADKGYVSEEQVTQVEEKNIDVFLSVSCEGKYDERLHDFRPRPPRKKAKSTLPWIKDMASHDVGLQSEKTGKSGEVMPWGQFPWLLFALSRNLRTYKTLPLASVSPRLRTKSQTRQAPRAKS